MTSLSGSIQQEGVFLSIQYVRSSMYVYAHTALILLTFYLLSVHQHHNITSVYVVYLIQ